MANVDSFLSLGGAQLAPLTSSANAAQCIFLANGTTPATLQIPANNNFDNHLFQIRLVGKATLDLTATLITAFLYVGSSSTTGGNTLFATTTGQSFNNGTNKSGNFDLQVTCDWDSTSDYLFGRVAWASGNVVQAGAAATGVSVTQQSSIQIVPFFKFGTTVTTCSAVISEFTFAQI